MKVLLVWKHSSDRVRFFAIENPTLAEIEALREADGCYINERFRECAFEECGLKGLDLVHAAISPAERRQGYRGVAEGWFSRWSENERGEDSVSSEGRFDRVFVSGFYWPSRGPAKLFMMRNDPDRSAEDHP